MVREIYSKEAVVQEVYSVVMIAVDVAIVGRRGGGSRSILRGNVVAIDVAIIGCC